MQVLHIIMHVFCSIAYFAMSFFAVSAWFRLRKQEKEMSRMNSLLHHLTAMVMGMHVQDNFDQVAKMRKTLDELVESENYEEAEKLKAAIDKMQEAAVQSLRNFREAFGDSIKEIVITKTTD